jgi:hypothetical protein
MLPGQDVTLPDGRTGQVLRLIASAVNGAHGMPTPGTLYELIVDHQRVYVGPIPHGRPAGWTVAEYDAAVAAAPRPQERTVTT